MANMKKLQIARARRRGGRRGRRVRGGAGVCVQRADRDLVRTKECVAGHCEGTAGAGCTIASANLETQVKPAGPRASRQGLQAAGEPSPGIRSETDLVIDGPGSNTAYGNVVQDLFFTGTGVVTFSG